MWYERVLNVWCTLVQCWLNVGCIRAQCELNPGSRGLHGGCILAPKKGDQQEEERGKEPKKTRRQWEKPPKLLVEEPSEELDDLENREAHNVDFAVMLREASLNDNHLEVQEILQKRPDVINDKDMNSGQTALHIASAKGNIETVKVLIEHEADIESVDNEGCTPLHEASIQKGDTDTIRCLIQHGVDPNHMMRVAHTWVTPLFIGSCSGQKEVVEFLLQSGANADFTTASGATSLYKAAESGDAGIVELLLDYKADTETPFHGTEGVMTPLFVASSKGNISTVKRLLEGNANPNFEGTNGITPLIIATKNDHAAVVKLLLSHGAGTNAAFRQGGDTKTALYIASEKGNTNIVELLLQIKAPNDVTSKDIATSLHIATKNRHTAVVELLQD
ncbi:ankyrin repeat domain-containing protein 29-like [Littorina saxatilis]|uniref:ankyrin repeat domain-containing protein 29-like n=1 Tax=Littorina saxatilis TaxID=31220 RepID=UPI0038B43EEB